ncbi:MAG: hypothetical protein CMO55_18635 [Verrucomicrobiales bacterium]|nr:hypothetical protein [Verrucomicrobiales bacterium]
MNGIDLNSVETGNILGSGTCGDVFEVVGHESTLLLKKYSSMAIDRRLMERTYLRLERIPVEESISEGLAQVYDFRFSSPPYCVLQERIDGVLLERPKSLKEPVVWNMIRQMAETLGHLHKHGVVHGHLHPGNIFLAERNNSLRPVLTDMGTGLVGDVHHIDLGPSTFFAAPDQLCDGGRGWDNGNMQRWEVYSFGLVAYWLLNGHLPRGTKYIKQWEHDCTSSGGRPVGIDFGAYVTEVYDCPNISWGMSFGVSREFKLYREVIEQCLELDPAKRPVDMREVRNKFRGLQQQFALEDAEDRVLKEKRKQRAKLFGARAVALLLGISFLGATYYLIDYLKKTYFFQNKVTELDQVVLSQKAHISHLDERWAETVTDLKSSREAADSFFQRMAQGDNAGGSGVATLRKEDLEKSRDYYVKILEDVEKGESGSEDSALEKARALHSLAHIEKRIGLRDKAESHFIAAITTFREVSARYQKRQDVVYDIHMRLADSFENVSSLLDNPISHESMMALEKAVEHFDRLIEFKPNSEEVVTRLAGTTFKLGKAYEAHRKYRDAIQAYSKSAELASALRDTAANKEEIVELIGKLQFRAAFSLRETGSTEEAINAHVAAMETLEELRGVNGFSALQSIQLASSYLELGELFAQMEAEPEDLDQLYNEGLRLLSPLNTESPEDVEVAVLLCRSLVHLGELERNEARWSAGYRLSVQGIEALKEALAAQPDHVAGTLALAEARLSHLEFMDGDDEAGLKLALLGVETADAAYSILENESVIAEPLRSKWKERLGKVFRAYGDICQELGDASIANRCFERASLKVSSR